MTSGFQFDQLYIISDLHFGGEPGFQIFGSKDEMLWFLDKITTDLPEQKIALVINGDFIDFLAERPALHFDPHGAISKLERITLRDPTFAPIFSALRTFLATPNRHLIINLGNHDLELALPWVNARLQEILTEKPAAAPGALPQYDIAAASRLHMIFDGSGVLLHVGSKSVLCVHGNEVDRWNPADFETLRKIARDVQFGRPLDLWIPNAGSKMVIEVMNTVKEQFPFVDLLKPELEAVVPILVACDPGQINKLDDVLGVVASRIKAQVFKPSGMLGEETAQETASAAATERPVSNAGRTAALIASQFPTNYKQEDDQAAIMMQMAEMQNRQGKRPLDLIQSQADQQLGRPAVFERIGEFFSGKSDSDALRKAVGLFDKGRSFTLTDKDDTYTELDKQVGAWIDYLVAGHTHLERAIRRSKGSGYYYNSGTWVRLIEITEATINNPDDFKDLFESLKNSDMQALDTKPGLIQKRCSIVVIRKEGDGVQGELNHIVTSQTGTRFQFAVVDGSQFPEQ